MRSLLLIPCAAPPTACAVGPGYSRPNIPVPESYRMTKTEGEAQSIANLPRWKLVNDEELQKLARITLEDNKDLKQAVAGVEESRARLGIARVDFAPQISASANAPPRSVRARFHDYTYAGNVDRARGIWWDRRLLGLYVPPVHLNTE